MYINVLDGYERHKMTLIATLKTVGSEIAETLKDTLFDSDSRDTSMSARLEQIASLEDIQWAVLEPSGKISFIPK